MHATRAFKTRDAALAWLRARCYDPATWTIRLVPGLGYVLAEQGYDLSLATRRAA